MRPPDKQGLFTNRPALTALVIYAAGIFLGVYFNLSIAILLVAIVILSLTGFTLHLKQLKTISTIFLYTVLLVCGIMQYRIAVDNFPPSHIKKIADYGGNTSIIGEIIEEPDIRSDKTYLTIEVDSLVWRNRQFASSGKILLKINQATSAFSFDDQVRFKGYLFSPGEARNPGGFDYSRYLTNDEIFAMMVLDQAEDIDIKKTIPGFSVWRIERYFINNIVIPIRTMFIEGFRHYLPANLASLLAGLTLGEKRDISPEIAKLFTDTGTLHLMAVSGSNVAIVAGFCIWVLAWVDRRARIVVTIVAVIFFSFLTRNEPSVVRATVMAIVGLVGFYRKRNADMMGLLGFAGLIILIWRPLWLFSVGFQLSIAATAGIIYFVPKFNSIINLGHGRLSKILYIPIMAFVTTIAAQVAVLPITAEYFQRLPLAGLIANLPMILLAGILTIGGILFLPFILIGGIAGSAYAFILKWLLSMIKPLLNFFANLPCAVINVNPPGVLKIILFFATIYFITELLFNRRKSRKGILLASAALIVNLGIAYLKGPPEESLNIIDCGLDRAILYAVPDGRNYLWFDCNELDSCQQIGQTLIPYLGTMGVGRIDTVFTDGTSKLKTLAEQIHVGNVLQYMDFEYGGNADTSGVNPYLIREFILNDKVNVGQILSDNNKELITGGIFFSLKAAGGKCILAGNMAPLLADCAIMPAAVIELPWSVQPYGVIYEKLKLCPPQLIVFSPEKSHAAAIGRRTELTYFSEQVWATSFTGSFRIRFNGPEIQIDHMVERR
jgi:competence protein ComEC